MDNYVILQQGQGKDAAADASIVVANLTDREVAEAERDSAIREIAPIAPMELIDHCDAPDGQDDVHNGEDSWGLKAIGADGDQLTGSGVTVALIDSGISKDHEAFDPFKILQKNFTVSGDDDKCGHGTHCAGILFGQKVRGRRIGVAPGVKRALIAKVTPDDGKISSDSVYQAMLWAVRERADIISMSLSFDHVGMVAASKKRGLPEDLALSESLISYRKNLRMLEALVAMMDKQEALGYSPLVVAAAGNQSRRRCEPAIKIGVPLPAAASGVVSVAAVARGPDGLMRAADFSNVLPTLAAPGVRITSAWLNGGLKCASGTSAACPHAAGVAALWLEHLRRGKRKVNAELLRATLRDNARKDRLVEPYDPSDFGSGIVAAPLP
ncbi:MULTISPECIES: S8 family serine peptidase [unclassified Bradyrhizobium]|uniref:S8 family serine peptidase n=1 Tax=unclassified Bradyrhizobium TaxID=2631580 RepID=UPI001FFA5647|nr:MULTISPECIES: S8 family serine peptidase [unclassified Bradyrhizobium]MCK1351536.1 S8 family serine peptidase [Bradyrhizobium sp. CW7]MCK1496981.1 S8 family serine peptidase [Bradyrhizobium sp. 188]MCK1634702.1 S8 family serine peptidase [Bradyrhizobium sp. 162]